MANTKITNHIVDSTVITGQTAVTAADGDYILVSDASDSGALKKVLASDLIQSSEEISDIVGAMVSSNTESGITVAYEDSDNTLDFTIGTLNQNTTGSAATLTTARTIHGVSFDGSANIDLSEVISDTVGAMFSSNTETNITVTYQDSDNTIDLVVDAAQPNITSLGTLTSLDVDNINLNGNTLSTSTGGLTLDVVGDIQLNADGGDITFNDGSDHIASFSNSSSNFIIKSQVQDKDILIRGNDGGSEITAVTLDMSLGGMATFLNATVSPATYNENVYITSSGTTAVNRFDNDGNDLYITYGGTSDKGLTLNNTTGMVAAKKSARIDQVAITSSSNAVAWDASAAANAYHVTTENTTFSAPSNAVEGAIISVEIAQGGTARTIAWNTVFEFAASTAPTITATANKTDILAFRYNGSVWQEIGRVQNMAQT